MLRSALAAAVGVSLAVPAMLPAQAALSLRAGTLGPSIGLTTTVGRRVNLRVDVPFFTYRQEGTTDVDGEPLAYTAEAKLFTPGALVDVYPFRGGFRLTAGAHLNGNEYHLTGRPTQSRTVGARTYSPSEIGTLAVDVAYRSRTAGYVGLGYGNPVAPNNRVGFLLDVGALYTGSPTVNMTATGMMEPTAEEAATVERNMAGYRWHPNVSIGLSVKLF